MRSISASTTIDVPREQVFELLTDLTIRPTFTDHFLEHYRLLRIDSDGVGAGARFFVPAANGWFDSIIERAEPAHTVYERGRGGRLNRTPLITVWELTETPATGGCEVTVTSWTEPPGFFDRMRDRRGSARRLRRGWRQALARLRDLAEDGAAPEPLEIGGSDRLGF